MQFEQLLDFQQSETDNGSNPLRDEYLNSTLSELNNQYSTACGVVSNFSNGATDRQNSADSTSNANNPAPRLRNLDPSNRLPVDIHNRLLINIHNRVSPVDANNRLPIDIHNRVPPTDVNNRVPPIDVNNRVPSVTENTLPAFPGDGKDGRNGKGKDAPPPPLVPEMELQLKTKSPLSDITPEVAREGLKQLREGLEKRQWPNKAEGMLMLATSLSMYLEDNPKDFLLRFASDSTDALQMSHLKDKIKVTTGTLNQQDRSVLAETERRSGAKLEQSGVLEIKNESGKVTDRVLVGVLAGSTGDKEIVVIKL